MSCYLFVLCPPYCGSTVLWRLLGTSQHVSALPAEGQFLPEVRDIMRAYPWRREVSLPWPHIKTVWESYWDHSKSVLLEKSPPNLLRTDELRAHFHPARFVAMVRDPYAHAEGLMRRNGWSIEKAARFTLMCLRTQRDNAQRPEDTLSLTYESLVGDPAAACERLTRFMPELGALDAGASFEIHAVDGTQRRPITDLNAQKIAALTPDTRSALSAIFETERDLLDAWSYPLHRD